MLREPALPYLQMLTALAAADAEPGSAEAPRAAPYRPSMEDMLANASVVNDGR